MAVFFLLLASISYGSLGVVAKFAYADGITPPMLTLSQMFFGALFFGLYKINKIRSFVSVGARSIAILGIGGAMSSFTAFCYYGSLQTLAASSAIIMLFQFVWIALLLELFYKKRVPSFAEIAAVIFCYIGTYLSVGVDISFEGDAFFGLFLGFLSGAFFAFYIFISSTFCLDESEDSRAFWIMASAFASSALMAISFFEISFLIVILKWGAICGALGVLIPFYIYAKFSPKIGTAATSIIGSAELPAALFLAAFLLGETIGYWQILGSFFVFLAIFVIFLAQTKAK